MTDYIERTSFGDLAGREVTWADPAAPHQITMHDTDNHMTCLVGCTCGAERIRQPMQAPVEEAWLAYNQLAHLPRAATQPLTTAALEA
jgi:hypothetical protein